MSKKIEISPKTIITIFIVLGGIWLLAQIKEILLGLFVALILMSALNPIVKKMELKKFPRWLAIILLYIVIISVLSFSLGGIIPPLVAQTATLIERIPELFQKIKILGIDQNVVAGQISAFTSLPANILKFVFGILSNVVGVFVLLMITFYLLMERKKSLTHFQSVLPEESANKVENLVNKIEERIGGWFRGQLSLMVLMGLLSYIGYTIIGIDYAIPLALLAFLLEVIPNVGPTVAAIPAVLVGLIISPIHALAVIGWCIFIQQLENAVLVPKIMNNMAGVNPLVSILSLAIGFQLAGVGGAVLAIPTFLILKTIFEEFRKEKGI